MIWSYLTSPADRLILALTCKSHMAVFQELRDNTQKPVRAKKSAKDTTTSSSSFKPIPLKRAVTKFDRLHILLRLETWMPKSYKLCFECLRFLPKTRAKREMTPVHGGNDQWSGKTTEPLKDILEKDIAKELKKLSKFGQKCPDCADRARLEVVAAKSQHRELKQKLSRLM